MIDKISQKIKEKISTFTSNDTIIFDGIQYPLTVSSFRSLEVAEGKKVAFVDGGQATILNAHNFCLSFIRVVGLVFENEMKIQDYKQEFYLFTYSEFDGKDIMYKSTIFSDGSVVLPEDLLTISSNDSSIREGTQRAAIEKVANVVRRFAELQLTHKIDADFVVLDGTLSPTFAGEEELLNQLDGKVCSLAKSSSLFTTSGNNPVILLNSMGPVGCWSYTLNEKTSFVKLHPNAKHVFRFEGSKEVPPFLVPHSKDALFLGYPYGLILVDKLARVSNQEKQTLRMKFLLREENKEILTYLSSSDAHDILDSLG